MKDLKSRFIYSALGIALLSLSPARAEKYEVQDLGKIEGGNLSTAYDVNNLGQAVGTASTINTYPPAEEGGDPQVFETVQGFIAQSGGTLQSIGVIEPNLGEPAEDTPIVEALSRTLNSQLFSINDAGLAVGYSDAVFEIPPAEEGGQASYSAQRYAAQYDGANLTLLPLPDSIINSVATTVNAGGTIMGYGNRPFTFIIDDVPQVQLSRRAWLYDPSAAEPFSWLPFPVNSENEEDPLVDFNSTVSGLNASNRAIGTVNAFSDSLGFDRAFYFDLGATELTELPMLTDRFHSSAEKINASGAILVNEFDKFVSSQSVFVFRSRGIIHDLTAGTQTDIGVINEQEDHTVAKDINDAGDVVGFARVGERLNRDVYHAFRYTADGGIVDLNTLIDCNLGWELLDARAINNNNEIVGLGFYTFDNEEGETVVERRAFRLTLNPDPEATPDQSCVEPNPFASPDESGGLMAPSSTLALALLGLLGRRRKRLA